jgi:hypothetical protein
MMNDQFNTNDAQLRLATSRALPPTAKLDADTASLREGFLALGAGLESAGSDFDEAALIERVRSQCADFNKPQVKEIAAAKTPNRFMEVVLGVVLAASVLLVVGRLVVVSPQADRPGEVVVAPGAPVQSEPEDFIEPNAEPSASVAKAWIDPLDEEIATAQAEMRWLNSRGNGLDGSLSQVGWQLEALSAELGGESL